MKLLTLRGELLSPPPRTKPPKQCMRKPPQLDSFNRQCNVTINSIARNASQSPLLQVPLEIRNQVWESVLGDRLIHMEYTGDTNTGKRHLIKGSALDISSVSVIVQKINLKSRMAPSECWAPRRASGDSHTTLVINSCAITPTTTPRAGNTNPCT